MATNTSTCYVIAAWSGHRRTGCPEYNHDRAYYLRLHLEQLQRLAHSLTTICIVVPECLGDPRPEFDAYLREVTAHLKPSTLGGADVHILHRPNIGMSYGSYSDAFVRLRSSHRYFFLIEDDYVPVLDHFDSVLIKMFEQQPNCGFLCGLIQDGHAAISIGLSRVDVLKAVWRVSGGCLPHARNSPPADYGANEHDGQIGLSRGFERAKYELHDWLRKFRSLFYNAHGQLVTYGDADKPLIFCPAEGFPEHLSGGASVP